MAFTRRLLFVSLFIVAATVHAQDPCVWSNNQTGKIVETCGTVGIGTTTPWGGMHVVGSGQSSNSPQLTSTTQSLHGSTLFVQDTGWGGGNGGMVAFGALQGHFAAIKGSIGDGGGHTTGDLLFLTRNTTSATALTERMRIFGNGHVGIGTTTDMARLRVAETAPNAWAFNAELVSQVTVSGNTTNLGAVIASDQNVAAGVTNSAGPIGMHLQAQNTGAGSVQQTVGQVMYVGSPNGGPVAAAYGTIINLLGSSVNTGFGLTIGDIQATTGVAINQTGANDTNYFAGNVGIGTPPDTYKMHVVGNVRVDGQLTGTNIQAIYQDVAEWVPATSDLAPGTVVVLNPSRANEVMASSQAYDTTVAGVVSAQPGVVLGVPGDSKEQIATTGRVRVRVDATGAPIRIGDLLVTSGVKGMAMRSEPMQISGRKFHQPGTIIGKALEPLESGTGEILVLLSMQ